MHNAGTPHNHVFKLASQHAGASMHNAGVGLLAQAHDKKALRRIARCALFLFGHSENNAVDFAIVLSLQISIRKKLI